MRKQITTIAFIALMTTGMGQTPNPEKRKLKVEYNNNKAITVFYKTAKIDGLEIFYREAGDKSKPTILLLHGFPSSSHMYRDIINDLAINYHVVAPDYPGFGYSSIPKLKEYNYTFNNLSITIEHFIDSVHLKKFSLYLQDYGGPVGFRIAARRPELIQSLIIQNANAYKEGLGEAVKPLVSYFENQNTESEKEARNILTTTKWQYTDGVENLRKVSPDSYVSDEYFLNRKGNDEIQLALFRSYGSNVALYDTWHTYFRKYQPIVLVVWGKNDQIFITPGAEAYKKDLKNIEVHLINGGHFLLEEHHQDVADIIYEFLLKKGIK